ncbi:hypothetical protein S40293_04360 [Stachybotrys chartarum IBT 40293]|nr:hypothetical protein S40293_04360 [Stachybotrys chartarum IBT 40293]
MSAKIFQIPFIKTTPQFKLYSIVQRSPKDGDSAPQDYPDIKHYTDANELIADPAVDVIVISTPPPTHFPLTKAALEAGKHVLTEKPFVPSSAQADELIALAKERNRLICVYQNRRWDTDFLLVKHLVSEGTLGRVVEFNTHFDRFRPVAPTTWKGQLDVSQGGTALFDLGTHLIDQVYTLFGLPQAVHGRLLNQREGRAELTSPDSVSAELTYPNGMLVNVKIGILSVEAPQPRFWVRGTKGSFAKTGLDNQEDQLKAGTAPTADGFGVDDPESMRLTLAAEDGTFSRAPVPARAPETYKAFYAAFGRAVESGREEDVPVKAAEARDVLRIIEAVAESARTGKDVSLARWSSEPAVMVDYFSYRPHSEPSTSGTPLDGPRSHVSSFRSSLFFDVPLSGSESDSATNTASTWCDDNLDFDMGFGPWNMPSSGFGWKPRSLPWHDMVGFKLEYLVRNPTARSQNDYFLRKRGSRVRLVVTFILSVVHCLLVAFFHKGMSISCSSRDGFSMVGFVFKWSSAVVATLGFFIFAQGYQNYRGLREKLSKLQQGAIILAFSFLKSTNADSGVGYTKADMQLIVYECLTLIAAYPVCVIEQIRGNACEPAVTRYCQQAAQTLQRLRNGGDIFPGAAGWKCMGSVSSNDRHNFADVEYFFEIFSLQLQIEFRRQKMKTRAPALASLHIIHNLRSHFENIVDLGNIDDRKSPVLRDNIDGLAQTARDCTLFDYRDIAPLPLLWFIDIAVRIIVLYLPIHHCSFIVSLTTSRGSLDDQDTVVPVLPAFFPICAVAAACTFIMMMLEEIWRGWNPVECGINPVAYCLSLATELDCLLHDFYEYDSTVLIRKHAYMGKTMFESVYESDASSERPLTV